VTGVRTDRPDGDLVAKVVIACDGVNSFLAREAGLYRGFSSHHFTLGVKEVLALGKDEIDRRFGLVGLEGVDIEMLGVTGGLAGGGFLYTNLETVSVGVVISVEALGSSGVRPEELIAGVKAHPTIAPFLRGAELTEYSAHLIPEGGYDEMPELAADGMLVAGDAAGMCLATGLYLEGVNFAIGSGRAAGGAAASAIAAGDTTAKGLRSYRRQLERSFVLRDHAKMRGAHGLILSERVQQRYPAVLCGLAEDIFTVRNAAPKPGVRRLFAGRRRRHGVGISQFARDAVKAWRSFG
jgi:electron transfer flavoprotein-quinone oxidoreductase